MSHPDANSQPGAWMTCWEWWKRTGKKIGNFQARLLLTIFYYAVFPPFAIAVRCFCDPLAIKRHHRKGWQARENDESAPDEHAARQF